MSDSEPVRSSQAIQLRLNRQRQLLAQLMRSDALTRGDFAAALCELTELGSELLRVERASVWRFDQQRQTIECADLYQAKEQRHAAGEIVSRDEVPRYFDALEAERCIAAHDAHADPRTSEFSEFYLRPHRIGALLDAPVFVGGEMVGVVCHEHVGEARHWEFWEELLAGTIADFVALVIEGHERVRTERELGLYKHHLAELNHLQNSELRKIQAELPFSEEESAPSSELEARQTFDASPVPLFVAEIDTGLIVYANRRAAALLDMKSEQLIGKNSYDFYVSADERAKVRDALANRGRVDNFAVRLRTSKSWPFWALLSAQRMSFVGRECVVVGLSDITAQKVAEAAVRRSERSVRTLFEAAPVAMVLTNAREAKVLMANQRAADMFGVAIAEVEGKRTYDFYVDPADRDRFIQEFSATGKIDGFVSLLRSQAGQEFWALMSARNIEFEGESALMTGISDITAQKQLEAQLRELATRDFLTGAYNRRHFLELAEVELQRSRRSGSPLSLCMFDIDFFKQLNDTHGHAAGDLALQSVVQACQKSLRAFDIFARFGGEEFIILYPDTELEASWIVTERVRDTIARESIALTNGGTANLTVSAGVAELLANESVEAMIRRADDALYRAKQSGRNRSISAPVPLKA